MTGDRTHVLRGDYEHGDCRNGIPTDLAQTVGAAADVGPQCAHPPTQVLQGL